MKLLESTINTLKRYADFSSRASREEFWYFFAFLILANAAASIVGMLLGVGPMLSSAVALLLIIPQLAVAVPAPASGLRVPGDPAADRRARFPRADAACLCPSSHLVHEEGHDRPQPLWRGTDGLLLRRLTNAAVVLGRPGR